MFNGVNNLVHKVSIDESYQVEFTYFFIVIRMAFGP